MKSRIYPDLQSPLDTYRTGYLFARQNNLVMDAIDALDGMNMILLPEERVKVLNTLDLAHFVHDAILRCPHCNLNFELTENHIITKPSIYHLPEGTIPPMPAINTFGQRVQFRKRIWFWVSLYHKTIEAQISGYRHSKNHSRE